MGPSARMGVALTRISAAGAQAEGAEPREPSPCPRQGRSPAFFRHKVEPFRLGLREPDRFSRCAKYRQFWVFMGIFVGIPS